MSAARTPDHCAECGLFSPCKTCGGGGKPRLGVVRAAPDEELIAALEELLKVSRDVWAAIVEHEGPPVLAGKVDVARAFIAAGDRARAAIDGAKP